MLPCFRCAALLCLALPCHVTLFILFLLALYCTALPCRAIPCHAFCCPASSFSELLCLALHWNSFLCFGALDLRCTVLLCPFLPCAQKYKTICPNNWTWPKLNFFRAETRRAKITSSYRLACASAKPPLPSTALLALRCPALPDAALFFAINAFCPAPLCFVLPEVLYAVLHCLLLPCPSLLSATLLCRMLSLLALPCLDLSPLPYVQNWRQPV